MALTQIKGSNIADGTVVAADVANDAVTTTKILNANVTTGKIADNAVTGAKIAMGSDAAGDVLTYNGTDYIRLAKGTAAQVLKMNAGATAVEWATDAGGIAVPGSSVAGDTLYHNGSIYTRLAKGTAAQVLTMNTGATAPEWAAAAAGGKVLQVRQSEKTDSFTSNGATPTLIPDMDVAITPTSTTSKILVFVSVQGSQNPGSNNFYLSLQRDSTLIHIGDTASSRERATFQLMTSDPGWTASASCAFLDPNTPADTSTAITYKLMGRSENSGVYWFINRSDDDGNSNTHGRLASSIIAIELAPN